MRSTWTRRGVSGHGTEKLYRLALRLYPRGFRDLFAEEMVQLQRDRLRDASPLAAVSAWISAFASAVRHGPGERLAELRERRTLQRRTLRARTRGGPH